MRKVRDLIIWTYRHGLINLKHRIRNRKMFENSVSNEFAVGNSSVTDSNHIPQYPSLCGLAARDRAVFEKFRSSVALVEALDHVTIDQGKLYIDEILKMGNWLESYSVAIKRIDEIGRPRKYRFVPFGDFSPTLIRYLKVYLDLQKHFGNLKGMDIAEIGVGFGGQSSMIHILNKPGTYFLYDIPPVLDLVRVFISELNLDGDFKYVDGRLPSQSSPDIVISNYAFSELSREVQKHYLDNVILNASRGYITWNSQSIDNLDGYTLADLVRIIPNSQIFPERPKTSESNVILVWNNSK
jgi:hypothetical protein